MAQAKFLNVLNSIALTRNNVKEYTQLQELIPWGRVDHHGDVKPNDPYQVAGEPLLAVTRNTRRFGISLRSHSSS